ncbi:MAG: hypothetical protein GAK35_02825 [Herbaspirillum frisingense]|uniref:Uncharacterized protein n=1 Tax=Herbaspirillum frisingense TaxID=92645 RepID=A0A7V8FVG5_9BURK|nr:MAG: hypothetical protein GAK35_02825 [Herbaspirillum frisingense]
MSTTSPADDPQQAGTVIADAVLLATLRAMPADPALRPAFNTLQQYANQSLEAIIAGLAARLHADTLAAQPPAPVTAGHSLAGAEARARRRAATARQCRAVAQEMVFAALSHLGDPTWNPLAPPAQDLGPVSMPNMLATLLAGMAPDEQTREQPAPDIPYD